MTGYIIRPARPDELEAIVHQRVHMFLDMGRDPALVQAAVPAMRAWTQTRMAADTLMTYFAIAPDGMIAAGAGVAINDVAPGPNSLSPERGYILNVYTEPEHRHRGLATRLVAACCDACRARGIVVVTLHASDEGRYVYEKLGFKPGTEMWLRLE
jgi:GNAT superfamily N-acetyltransferase